MSTASPRRSRTCRGGWPRAGSRASRTSSRATSDPSRTCLRVCSADRTRASSCSSSRIEGRRAMQQLTSLDANFLAMESSRTYGHVGGLAVLDPSGAPGGGIEVEDLRRVVAARLDKLPPLRWKLVQVPLGLDHPYWIVDPGFDLDFHIRESAIPPPGSDRQLAETVSRMFARALDRSHPLWELYLIHGLPEGRVAILTKFHHAAIDGVSGAEILGTLFDLTPEGEGVSPNGGGAEEELEVGPGNGEREPTELEMLLRGVVGMPR